MIEEESAEDKNSENMVDDIEEDVAALKEAVAEEKKRSAEYLTNWQRTQADFLNYKKRSEQDKEEISKFANSILILGLLPVLDDLERAFTSIPAKLAKHSWVDGIRLIERKFRAGLETQGLLQIKALGEPFNPKVHEAAMHTAGKEGMVIEELQKGYKLRDRVVRPSVVVVGNGEEKVEKKEEEKEE